MKAISWTTILEIVAGGAAVLSVFVEISPIKINPISAVLRWIGKKLNADIKTKVDKIESELQEFQKAEDEKEVNRLRWEILDFANSCKNHRKHTRDEFTHIIGIHDDYLHLLRKHGRKNGQIDLEYLYIQEIYQDCLRENTFLP